MTALFALIACTGAPDTAPPPPPRQELNVATDPLEGERAVAHAGAPNVVLVIGCTVRRDRLLPYGGKAMPGLEAMGERGVVFDDPINAAPWTRAASTALLTAHHAVEVGMTEPSKERNDRVLPEEVVTLAEHFRAAGYNTIGGTANPNLNSIFAFHQGFDAYVEPPSLWRDAMRKVVGGVLNPQLLEVVPPASERPLYLQVMYVDAHSPYPGTAKLDRDDIAGHAAAYEEGLSRLDDVVQELRAGLKTKGYDPSNTVFVFTSDHGEGLGLPLHHGHAHGRYLYSSTIQGVWVMEGAGVPSGRRVRGVASQVDVGPTLAALAGVPSLESPSGRSLLDALKTGETGRAVAFADTWFKSANRAAMYTSKLSCMKSFGELDMPVGKGRFVPGCYDRTADPLQEVPLQPSNAAALRVIDTWRKRVTDRALTPRNAHLDGGLAEQLEVLGYTGD